MVLTDGEPVGLSNIKIFCSSIPAWLARFLCFLTIKLRSITTNNQRPFAAIGPRAAMEGVFILVRESMDRSEKT